MKSQYFGDINDYWKYGLLRLLAEVGGLRIGLAWMLTPDNDRPDGGKIDYLTYPDRWRKSDPDLFDLLIPLDPAVTVPLACVTPGQKRACHAPGYEWPRERFRPTQGLLTA